jgi:hypothetical protein
MSSSGMLVSPARACRRCSTTWLITLTWAGCTPWVAHRCRAQKIGVGAEHFGVCLDQEAVAPTRDTRNSFTESARAAQALATKS